MLNVSVSCSLVLFYKSRTVCTVKTQQFMAHGTGPRCSEAVCVDAVCCDSMHGMCVSAVCWDSMHGKVYVGVVWCDSVHGEVCACCVFRGKAAVAMRCNPGRGCRATSDSLRPSIPNSLPVVPSETFYCCQLL